MKPEDFTGITREFLSSLSPEALENLSQEIVTGTPVDYTKIYKTQEELDAEPGVLTRGLMGGGVYGTGSLLTGAAGLAADAVGADDTAQSLLETSQNIARKGQELYPQKADFDQVLNDPSLSNIGEWLGYNVAATAPMMIGSMGIGGVAGLTAKAMLKKAAAEAGEAAVKKATASELALIGAEKIAQEASEKVLGNAVRAGTAGSVTAMAPVEAGGMWIDDAQKHGVENTSPIQDALFGAGSAGLEALGLEASVLGKLLGKGGSEVAGTAAETLLGRLGQRGMSALKEGSKQFVNEGLIEEAGQEGIAMINEALNAVPGETPDIVTDKGLKRLAESGIVGGVAGFAPGTLMGALRHKTQDKVVPEVKGATDILGQDGGFEYQNDTTNPFESHETGFGDTQEINQYQAQSPRNASQFLDLLDQEENGLSLSGLSGMNPQNRQLEMLHQSRLNPSALDMLKQSYMADVVGGGFPSDVTQGAAAQSAGVFENNIRQTELGRLAGLLTNLSGAKQQAEEQARDAAIVQSPIGSQLLADRLRQEEMSSVVPVDIPARSFPTQQVQPAFVPLPVEDEETSVSDSERMSEPEMLPQSVPVEVKKTLPVGSKIEWNDKKGNTLAGTITGIRGSRYEIERENPQPGQGKKTFLHTDYKVREVDPESYTEKKENFSGVNTDSSDPYAVGFSWDSKEGRREVVGMKDGHYLVKSERFPDLSYMIKPEYMAGEIAIDRKDLEYEQREKEIAEEKAEQARQLEEEKKQRPVSDVDSYLDTIKDRLHKAKTAKALKAVVGYDNGKRATRSDYIKEKLSDGWELETAEVPKIKDMSSQQFFRATQKEQDAHAERQREAGNKTEYRIGRDNTYQVITKTEYDYANHLKNAEAAQSQTSADSGMELAEGFDPLKTLMTPASQEDIRAAEEERQQKDAKKSQLVSAIEDLKQRKEKLVADRDSWASREYRGNSQTVTTGGQDEYDTSTTRTISQLNEGRRSSKIKSLSEQYRETDAAIKALEHRLKMGKHDIQKTDIGDDYLIPEIDEFEGERMPEYQIEKTTSPPVSKTPLETMQNEKASLEQKPNKSAEDWQRIDDLAYGIDDIKQGKEPDMSLIGGEMTDSQKKEADFYRQKQNLYDQKNKLKDKITSAEKKLEKMGAMTPPSVKSEVSTYIHKLYDEMESLDNSIDAAYSEEEKPEASNYDSAAYKEPWEVDPAEFEYIKKAKTKTNSDAFNDMTSEAKKLMGGSFERKAATIARKVIGEKGDYGGLVSSSDGKNIIVKSINGNKTNTKRLERLSQDAADKTGRIAAMYEVSDADGVVLGYASTVLPTSQYNPATATFFDSSKVDLSEDEHSDPDSGRVLKSEINKIGGDAKFPISVSAVMHFEPKKRAAETSFDEAYRKYRHEDSMTHEDHVRDAMENGRHVPSSVLAWYKNKPWAKKYFEKEASNYDSVAEGQKEPDSLSDFMEQIENERASFVLKATLNAMENKSAWEQRPELKPYEDRIRQAITDRIDTLNAEYDEMDRERKLKRQSQKEATQKGTFPVADDKLTAVDEITERIKSIESQIERLESTGTGKSVVAWGNKHEKIKKLNKRKDVLWIKRAGLIKSSKVAPESQLETTETYSVIGKNADGRDIFEDKNGIRSYLDENIRHTEPVAVTPKGEIIAGTNQKRYDNYRHEFLTNDEIESFSPKKTNTENDHDLEKSGESTLERVQADDVQGVAEGGKIERGVERSGKENTRGHERTGESGVSEPRSMGDGEGEIPVSSGRGRTDGRRGSERSGEVLHGVREGNEQDSSGGGRKLTPDEKPAGIHEKAGDFSISKDDAIGEGGAKTKFKNNIAAIKLLARINKENRPANKEEQKILAKYVGWGGIPQAFYRENGSVSAGWDKEAKELKETLPENEYLSARRSTQDAHYTSTEIVKSIWDAVKRLGFRKGRVLEPSVGVGNFIGLIPRELKAKTRVTGVELDPTTGGIAKLLYPNEDIHTATGFQDFNTPDNYFDIAVGNPPFGSTKLFDSRRKEISRFSIHNYFFAKSIDAIRPGGLLAMVVSSNFMDAANSDARKYIAEKANLVAAWRLPNNAFLKNAGTEVTTDIIILQKRDSDTDPNGVDWIGISSVKDPEGRGDVPLNEYFVKKPGNMFGRFGLYGSMYRPDMPALVAVEGQNTAGLLAEAINSLPENIFKNTEKDPVKEVVIDPADITGVKVGSMFIKDGAVFLRGENVLNRPTYIERQIEGRAFERVSGMIGIRDAFTTLRRLQLSETAKDSEIDAARQRLNTLYDAFVKKNGFVLSEANKRIFREDPTWPQLAALEEQYDKGISRDVAKKTGEEPRQASAKKAAIFSKRTQYPYTKPTAAKNAKDALSISLSQKGDLDLEYMQSLYGKGEEEITRELKGLIFKTPAGEFQTREQYLNGNVKKKLAEAIEAAKTDPLFNDNIDALKAVQPADIEPVDINVKPGSHWIPASDIKAFISHISGTGDVEASYVPANAKWYISIKNTPESAETRWGTPRAYVGEIIAAVLNQGQITIKDRTDDGGYEINHEETAAANNKISLVKEEWNNWVWDDDDRRARLARIYNDNFNTDNLVPHDGSHLSFPGKVGDDIIKLRPHQANAVWRIMQDGKALLDHVVGAGKTFTMIAAAMEMRRTGISKKPLFVVPNHLVSQWAGDFVRLYPGAEILAASKKDFEKSNRKRLFERITTGDWDAVIIAHSSFVKMPVEPEFEARFLNEQLLDLEESISAMRETEGRNARSVKQQEKMRDNLKAKLQKVMDRTEKDDVVNFGELGVDSLFVDEAHEFKNLAYFTSLQRVGGVTSGQGSNKASDLYMKARQVMNSTGGKNVVFATGTPISNSMAEMFTIQRYLDYDNLKDQGLSHFDAWARMFGDVVTDWELSPAGKYQLRGRFSKFVNMPELLSKYRGFADVINREDIIRQLKERGQTLPVPKIKGGKPQNIITERSPEQAAYIGVPKIDPETQQEEYPVGSLVWRSEHLPKGKPQKGDDNMLVIMNDARKAALDMRLINPNAPDFAGSKVNTCARNIKELYDEWDKDKGAQLVFCDLSTPKKAVASAKAEYEKLLGLAENGDDEAIVKLDRMSPDDIDALNSQFSVYDDLKEKLVRLGIPSREIAFIHDANTDIQKEELFAKVRSGKIRVLVGSSSKMGAGMNVQERLVALHHLDAPWRPSDLEQREGRIIRQGNRLYEADPEGFEVSIMRYASEQTLDSRMWQIIETKARFIEQVRKGNLDSREIEDVEGEAANAAEMKAASSGNPLILEENDLRTKIKKLEDEKKNHDRSQHNIKQKISGNNRWAARRREKIKELESDMAVIPKFSEDFYLNGKKIDKRKEAGAKLLSEIRSYAETDMSDSRKVGRFGEFSIELEGGKSGAHEYLYVRLVREGVYGYEASFALDQKKDDVSEIDGSGLITRIENSLKRIPEDYDSALKAIRELEADMPKLEKQIQAWNKTGELARLKERHREVIDALKPRSQEQPNTPKENEGETNQDEASGIKYSISESGKPGKGMSKQAVSDSLASGRSKMAFKVVQSEDELPAHIREDIESKGVSGRAEALFDPETGTAYFIADNIGSVKAAQTGFLENLFRHEGRHAAISQMFESKGSRNLFMDRAARLFKSDVAAYMKKNGMEDTKENTRIAAEEALVSQAVKGGVHGLVDEFLSKVMRWARKIFPNLSMTKAEARDFIRRVDSALRVGDFAKKEGFSGKSDGKGVLDTEKEPVKYSIKDRPTSLKDLGIATEYSDIKTLDENGGTMTGKKLVISGNFRARYDELMKVIGGKYRFEKKAGAKGVTARNIYEFKNPPETIENDIAEIIRAHHGLEDMGLKPKFRESEKGTSLFINGDKVHLMASAMKKIGGKFISPAEPGRKPFLVFNNPDAAKVGKIAAVAKESTDSLARMQKTARDTAQNNLNLLVKPKDESAKATAGRVFDDLKSLFSKSGITLPSNNTDFVKGLHWVQTEIDIARNDADMKALYDINERYNAIATQVTTQDRDATKDYYELDKEERKAVNEALLAGDEERVKLTDGEVKERFSLSDKQVKGFRAIRNVLDNKLVQIVNDMVKHAFSDLYLDDDTAREILSRKIVDSLTRNEVTQLLKEYGVDPKEADKVSWLFDWINERKGYIPHKWDSEWLVRVNMPDGETYLLDVPTVTGNILPTKALREGAANKAAVRVIKERIGWSDEQIQEWIDQGNIRLVKSKKMDVDLFHGASMHTMNAIIDSATEKAWEENKDAFSTEQLMKQDDLKKAIRKEMEELFLAKGAGRHFIARKGVKGFRTDIDNILAEYIGGINHWMVKRDKAMEFSKAMKSIDPKETPVKFKHARAFVDDMLGESSEASWFKRFAGMWFLGADVSAAALNGFQNFTHAAPEMMKIKGSGSVYSQLGKAMQDAFGEWRAAKKEGRSIFTGESRFISKEEAGKIRDLYEQGFFDPAVVGEQTGFHPSSVWNNYADVGMRKLMFMFTGVESLNRSSTFLAAYRRAKAAGVADPVQIAKDVVMAAHFPGGKGNRPLLVRRLGALGNIGYTFMMFPVNNFFFLKNIFKDAFKAIHGGDKEKIKTSLKVVGAHLGALMSIGGLSALPFASILAPLIKGIFSDDDDDWEVALRKHLPEEVGRALVRGIPAVLGNDMSGRISGDITGMPAGFGVIQTMAKRANKAGMYLSQGETLDAAMILMPDFIRNPYNAVMGMKEGGEKRGRSPVKYTGWQAFNKAMGFSPTEETEAYAAKQSIDNVKAKRSDMLESFAEDLNQLRKKGNTAAIASLRKKVAEYNSVQAKDNDPVIKWSDVLKSAKQREKMRNKGYMDRVSKGMKGQKKAALAAFEG